MEVCFYCEIVLNRPRLIAFKLLLTNNESTEEIFLKVLNLYASFK